MSLRKVEFKIVSREPSPRICTPSHIAMNKLLPDTEHVLSGSNSPVNREHMY